MMVDVVVPDRPDDMKVVVASHSSMLITWLPPIHSNGVLTEYTVYINLLAAANKVPTAFTYILLSS